MSQAVTNFLEGSKAEQEVPQVTRLVQPVETARISDFAQLGHWQA
jgi:hypothetical protein